MDSERTSRAATSLPLIVITLLAGIALGWLLHDVTGRWFTPNAPTPTAIPSSLPTSVAGQPTAVPTIAPTIAPTATATATATAQPTAVPTTVPSETPAPAPTEVPTPLPTQVPTQPPSAASYIGHIVAAGETLETIAAAGGSTPDLITRYNLLTGEPQPGRALVVPQLAGTTATLANEPMLVQKGPGAKPWVALTLDAGASAEPVPDILATLRQYHITITFFLTGKWISENPELTRQIVADGHEVANHSFNHPDMRNLSAAAIAQELSDTEAALAAVAPGASTRPFFRPPYGAYDERVLTLAAAQGYVPIYWTLDSLDSVGEPKTPEFLLERVTAKLTPEQLRGAIILAHCGSRPTADALPAILDRFAELGFEVRKLSDVLAAA